MASGGSSVAHQPKTNTTMSDKSPVCALCPITANAERECKQCKESMCARHIDGAYCTVCVNVCNVCGEEDLDEIQFCDSCREYVHTRCKTTWDNECVNCIEGRRDDFDEILRQHTAGKVAS